MPLQTPGMTSPTVQEWKVADRHPARPPTKVSVVPELHSGAGPLREAELESVQEEAVTEKPQVVGLKPNKGNEGPAPVVHDVSEKPPVGAEVIVDVSPDAVGEHPDVQEDGTITRSSGGASAGSSDNEGSEGEKEDGGA